MPRRATASGVPPFFAIFSARRSRSRGRWHVGVAVNLPDIVDHGVDRALADLVVLKIDAADARLRGERDEVCAERSHVAPAYAVALLGQHNDGAAFRGLVGKRGELCGIRQLPFADARQGHELRRLPVAERDGARLVEKQRIDVARGLDRAAGHGQHVEAHEPVHPCDADGRKQRADGRRNKRHEQRHKHDNRDLAARVGGKARDARDREDEDDGHAGQQDIQRDFIGRFLTLGAFDKPDHPVEEGRALGRGDAHDNPVGDHHRATGHGRAVAARLPDDRRGLAGDGGFVHGGNALDDLAIRRDQIARLHKDDVAGLQLDRGDLRELVPIARIGKLLGDDIRLCRAQAARLAPCPGPRPRLRRSSRTEP